MASQLQLIQGRSLCFTETQARRIQRVTTALSNQDTLFGGVAVAIVTVVGVVLRGRTLPEAVVERLLWFALVPVQAADERVEPVADLVPAADGGNRVDGRADTHPATRTTCHDQKACHGCENHARVYYTTRQCARACALSFYTWWNPND